MNIFENYSTLIKKLIINNQKILNLENLNVLVIQDVEHVQ